MANEVLVKQGSQIRFAVAGSLSPTDPGTDLVVGTPAEAALTMTGILNSAGRQSIKIDLGATRAALYAVLGAFDFTGATPTIGSTVDIYWAPSTSGTQAQGNIAGNSGADGAAPDGALGSITFSEFILMCQFVGSLPVHDGGVVQNGLVGVFSPNDRYGQMIVANSSGATFAASNVEAHVVMNPIIDEIQ